MKREKLIELSEKIKKIFPKTSPPAYNNLTEADSLECIQINDDFYNVEWWNVDDALIEDNFDKLTWMTPVAFHYYLPAYILRSLSDFDPLSDVLEGVIYNLSLLFVNELRLKLRREQFTPEEIKFLVEYLKHLSESNKTERLEEEIQAALDYWYQP